MGRFWYIDKITWYPRPKIGIHDLTITGVLWNHGTEHLKLGLSWDIWDVYIGLTCYLKIVLSSFVFTLESMSFAFHSSSFFFIIRKILNVCLWKLLEERCSFHLHVCGCRENDQWTAFKVLSIGQWTPALYRVEKALPQQSGSWISAALLPQRSS